MPNEELVASSESSHNTLIRKDLKNEVLRTLSTQASAFLRHGYGSFGTGYTTVHEF